MQHQPCTFGGGLFRRACGAPARYACVYCGQPFCEQHGDRGVDFTDVCHRRQCQAKVEDLAVHLQWKRDAGRFNEVAVCANEGCNERMRHQCSQCRLLFCVEHLEERQVTSRLTDPPSRILVVICEHCKARRQLWD